MTNGITSAIGQLLSSPLVGEAATIVAIGGTALWLAAAWWTYLDMTRRTGSEPIRLGAAGWILISTPLLLPLSLPIYLFVRPQQTAAQRESDELVRELSLADADADRCPGCALVTELGWKRCPACATWLETECADCGRWSRVELSICPWCASERDALGSAGVLIGLPLSVPPPKAELERRREPAPRLARLG
jgi:hypothetical protein